MIEQAGRFIGMMAADIANLFRGRQLVPCTVEWEQPPGGWFAFGSHVDFGGPLEFSEEVALDGLPKWERPLPLSESAECCDSCEHGCWGE